MQRRWLALLMLFFLCGLGCGLYLGHPLTIWTRDQNNRRNTFTVADAIVHYHGKFHRYPLTTDEVAKAVRLEVGGELANPFSQKRKLEISFEQHPRDMPGNIWVFLHAEDSTLSVITNGDFECPYIYHRTPRLNEKK